MRLAVAMSIVLSITLSAVGAQAETYVRTSQTIGNTTTSVTTFSRGTITTTKTTVNPYTDTRTTVTHTTFEPARKSGYDTSGGYKSGR
jgi:hypothetical protein